MPPTTTWPSQQIGNPTGVMPVGLSCWPSGLNPAVPFPTCAAGVIPTGQGNIVQQALELARRAQENLKAGAPIHFVQQNVQPNIQDERRHVVAEDQWRVEVAVHHRYDQDAEQAAVLRANETTSSQPDGETASMARQLNAHATVTKSKQPLIKKVRGVRHCFAYLNDRCMNGNDCKFPHLTEKEIDDKVVECAAGEAVSSSLDPYVPCGEKFEYHAIAAVVVDDLAEEETFVRGGRTGYVTFIVPENDAPKYEELDFDIEYNIEEPRLPCSERLKDPVVQEVEDLCALHKAELMHLSLGDDLNYDRVKCGELNGYALQTMVQDDTLDNEENTWVESQWTVINEPPAPPETACAASQSFPELAKGLWLMDTGCAHDLVNKNMAEGFEKNRLSNPYAFTTANGRTLSYQTVLMFSKAMGGQISPYLLPETPSVLSICKRCMEEGYSFIWHANEAPYLETPNGGCISLRVERNIPYLDTSNELFDAVDRHVAAVPVAVADAIGERNDEQLRHESTSVGQLTAAVLATAPPGAQKQMLEAKLLSKVSQYQANATAAIQAITRNKNR